MLEPIEFFYEKYGIDLKSINQIICGKKYIAVWLKNGQIGVCATLNNYVNIEVRDLRFPDLNNIQHRIVLNAYYNAIFNYQNKYDTTIDIFDKINFSKYKKIVMIGFFRSLVDKFNKENIKLKVFDKTEEDSFLTDMQLQLSEVAKADALILSATSIFNKTFMQLINSTNTNCDTYTLGPSNILNPEMFQYRNTKVLFGTTFDLNDVNTLKIIQMGGGTKQFLPFMNKVFLKPV
ncbi:MAG: hypothetical protein MI739_09700 [Bacteroidales bacterium]|nr:hypothetical protein [Bacteroidales bacterium]